MEKASHTVPQKPPKPVFVALAIVIFFLALSAADSVGFVPDYIDGTAPLTTSASAAEADTGGVVALTELSQLGSDTLTLDASGTLTVKHGSKDTDAANTNAQLPVHISISAIGLDLAIQNPSTTNVDVLDALLVNGPARYTESAKLGESGNMIIFAHSSHLPIVHNKMFQAFNRIPELKAGDTITLTGQNGAQYLYRVNGVAKKSVDDNVSISLAKTGTKLTLVTCDTLTGKSARYVLDADFIGTTATQ